MDHCEVLQTLLPDLRPSISNRSDDRPCGVGLTQQNQEEAKGSESHRRRRGGMGFSMRGSSSQGLQRQRLERPAPRLPPRG
mmetsp:Transcript_8077/g.19314  ORF Transcript_8077/g.19314 Transcript_8077/m.19314 type:complete len:81 (-) Transcript_8077:73-315(-)